MNGNYFNRETPIIENGIMQLNYPRKHLSSGNIVIGVETLIWAEEQGAKIVHVKCGKKEYRASMEQIRYGGYEYGGYVFLPIWKWHNVKDGFPRQHKRYPSVGVKNTNRKAYRDQHKRALGGER